MESFFFDGAGGVLLKCQAQYDAPILTNESIKYLNEILQVLVIQIHSPDF